MLMSVADKIETYVNSIAAIHRREIDDFVAHAQTRIYKKRELFLREQDVCQELLFVDVGAFRYFVTNDGNDYTKDFCLNTTNPFCTGFASFVTQTPALINIEALEESRVLVWEYKFIRPLFSTMPWLQFSRAIAELLFVRKERREISLLKDNAAERYKLFTKMYKDTVQRVPQYHIASYLGITPESLSRVRRSLHGGA